MKRPIDNELPHCELEQGLQKEILARLWTTQIEEARGADYETFARVLSQPMFASMPGCVGALFLGIGSHRAVLSLWLNSRAIEQAEASIHYQDTVASLVASGVLRGAQQVSIWPVREGFLRTSELFATTPRSEG